MNNEINWKAIKGWSAMSAILGIVFLMAGHRGGAIGTLGALMLVGGLVAFVIARFEE